MRRFGQLIELRPGAREAYVKYHAAVWPGVLQTIAACQIRNYSIFLREAAGTVTLFAYFEYLGSDFEADMRKMAADPITQEWWAIMEPLQLPLPDRRPGEWWTRMEEVFHTE